MKVDMTVMEVQSKMGEKKSDLAPDKVVQVPVWTIVAVATLSDTTYQLGIQTLSRKIADRFQVGQSVQCDIWPQGKLMAVEDPMEDGEDEDAAPVN